MLTLAQGAIVARIIGVISIPVLTRLYAPEDYGVLAMYTALIAMVAPILTARYVQAIPLPKSEIIAAALFYLCLKYIVINAAIIFIIFYFFGDDFFKLIGMQSLAKWWVLLVLGIVSTAFYELLTLWATRAKRYRELSSSQVSLSIQGVLLKIVLGVFSMQPAGLLVGQFVSQGGGAGGLLRNSYKSLISLRDKIDKSKIRFARRYYWQFPVYRLPSEFLAILSVQAPILMMALLYGDANTGMLSLALSALSLPSSLIGVSISRAYYAEVASLGRKKAKEIKKLTFDVQKKLFMISLPIMVVLVMFSQQLFSFAFGKEWEDAGTYAAILAPYVLFQFTSSPLMKVINVVGSQLHILLLYSARVAGLIIVFLFARCLEINSKEFVVFISFYLSAFYILMTVFIILMVARVAKKPA